MPNITKRSIAGTPGAMVYGKSIWRDLVGRVVVAGAAAAGRQMDSGPRRRADCAER
jgi:hypothetical protein